MNQEEFFQQHAVNGELSPELMAQMLNLPQGDTTLGASPAGDGATPSADEPKDPKDATPPAPAPNPAPAPTPAPAPADAPAPAPTPAPVILAKDGVHTIPYEKLEEARKQAQEANEQAQRLAAENEALKKGQVAAPAPATVPPAPAPASTKDGENLFGDYSDEQLRRGVETIAEQRAQQLVEQRMAPLMQELEALKGQITPLQKQQQVDAATAHWSAIYGAHPDVDSIVESAEFKAWRDAQPAFMRPAIDATLSEGTAPEVIELFATYKNATGKTPPAAPAPAPAPAAQDPQAAAAAAAAAIANAKTPPPTSLSEIPAGASAHHDEAAAMLEMSPVALMGRFEGMTPAQIQERLSKVI